MIICLGTTPALQRTMTFARLELDAVNRAIEVREYASGKSINVARVAHTLGAKVLATGFLGGDRASVIRRDLDSAGIGHDLIDVAAPTRMCVTVIDSGNHTATELVEEAPAVGKEDANRLLSHLQLLLSGAKAVVMSGTLAPIVPDDFYARCVALASERNVATIVDAKGPPLRNALAKKPTIVKPNRAELAATVDTEVDDQDSLFAAMRRCIDMGAGSVIVTDGPRDAFASNRSDFWKIQIPQIASVSPIGSGDAFAAGVAVAIARGEELPQACALGAACGAANAMTAFAGHVNRPTVEYLRNQIAVTRV